MKRKLFLAAGRSNGHPTARPKSPAERENSGALVPAPVAMAPVGDIAHRAADDVVALSQALALLREREARFRRLTALSADWYWRQDENLRFTAHDGGAGRQSGLFSEEDVGKTCWELPVSGVSEAQWRAHRETLAARQPFRDFEFQRKCREGRMRWVSISGEPTFDPAGRFTGYQGVGRDITERKRRNLELQRLRAAMDATADAIYLSDRTSMCMVDVNRAGCEMVGKSREALLDMRPEEILGVSRVELEQVYDSVIAGGTATEPVELLLPRRNGSRAWVQLRRRAYHSDDGWLIVGVASDISERKRAEQMLVLEQGVARCLAEGGETSTTMRELLRTICETERWDCGAWFRVEAPTGAPRRIEAWCTADTAAELDAGGAQGPAFAPTSELISRVWRSGEPASDDPGAAGVHAAFAFPVTADGRTLGVLAFSGAKARTPDQRLLQAAGVIGSQAGQFLRRKQKEEELRESEARYRALAEMSADWYWEHDENQRLTKVSDHVFANVEVNGEALLGKTLWETDIRYDAAKRAALEADIEARRALRDFNFTRITASGVERHVQISGEPMYDTAGRFCGYRGIGRDITERIHAEEKLAYLAQYDSLTGLANRELFRDRLAQSLTQAERNECMVGILYIDLDGFKGINDTYGHDAGDRLLTLVAERLQSCVRHTDTVGRLGGDEFAIVIANLADADDADLVAEQAVAQLAQPFDLDGRETLITASIGISIYPIDGMDANLLLKNADTAMYQGKEQGRNNFQNYSVELDDAAACRRQLELELRHAIEHEEFELHYQPQVSLDTGRVIGVEAMLRWWHPVHGMLTAGEFIEVAEETGLIVQIGHWVFETACKQTAEWQRAGLPELFVAVNVSPVEIQRGRVVEQVQRALERSGLAPRHLEIELTESVITADAEAFTNTLIKLKDLGISIAIDNFGTGYSSLSSLKNFPINKVKIDQTFTRDIVTNPDDSAIVQAVIAMSHHLQLEVVSKGVETEHQAGFLRRCRCDIAQGFLFGAPMQAAHLKELLDDSDGRLRPARSSLGGPAPPLPLRRG